MRLDEFAPGRLDLRQVDAFDTTPERTRPEAALEDRRDQGSEPQGVVGRHQVDRRPHQRCPNGTALDDRRREGLRAKAVEPRPETDVRCERRLRLHPDEMLDGGQRGHRFAHEQHLAGEQGAVERAWPEHRVA